MAAACGECGALPAEYLCSRCKVVRFCGPECFRKAWKGHKPYCQPTGPSLQPPSGASTNSSLAKPEDVPKPKAPDVRNSDQQMTAPGRSLPPPQKASASEAAKPVRKIIDYSRFDHLEDSDEEREKALKSRTPSSQGKGLLRFTQKATELITLQEFRGVFKALLEKSDPPTLPPDAERMFTAFKSCPDTTDRALFDQACQVVEDMPAMLSTGAGGVEQWKKLTLQLANAMMTSRRFDEARMWCMIRRLRYPNDLEPLQMHAFCLEEMCTNVLHQGDAKVPLPSATGSRHVPLDTYAETLQCYVRDHLRKIVEICDGSSTLEPLLAPALAGLSASLEKSGKLDEARKVGQRGLKLGHWSSAMQRPAHVCKSLLPGKAWHDAEASEICGALEQVAHHIKDEFERYMGLGKAPLANVGARSGEALLVETGSWKELPLFNNGRLDHEVCMQFPETVRMLTERCADATGLAFCGGGEVAFRIMSPGTKLRPHCGPTNARLTCLLGVSVPLGAEPGVSVGGEPARPWIDGRCIVFDDSFEHSEELDEMAEGDCVLFMLHFWHPGFQHKNDPQWRERV